MRILKGNEYRIFEHLVSLTQAELYHNMAVYLKAKYDKVITTSDYILAIGDIPIALAAHLDTVFHSPVVDLYYDQKKGVMWSPQGLGADDRAGIFAIIQIIKDGYRPSIILTTDEEKGGLGAAALGEIENPIKNLKYIIELDRRGTNDCVFYECNNQEFIKYIENFGFIESIGTFSDISFICPSWKVCGVNLSVGYEGEHRETEILHINVLMSTIDKVKAMLSEKDIPNFEWQETLYSSWYNDYFRKINWKDVTQALTPCHKCKKQYNEIDLFPVEMKSGSIHLYCPECIADDNTLDWCRICGDPYEKIDEAGICHTCRAAWMKEEEKINV